MSKHSQRTKHEPLPIRSLGQTSLDEACAGGWQEAKMKYRYAAVLVRLSLCDEISLSQPNVASTRVGCFPESDTAYVLAHHPRLLEVN